MFLVHYCDDDRRKHICVAKDLNEVRFLDNRFGVEKFETVSDKVARAIVPSATDRFLKN